MCIRDSCNPLPVEDKVYTGPSIAVGEEHPSSKVIINNPKIIFLLIIVETNLIQFMIQLKVELNFIIIIIKLN